MAKITGLKTFTVSTARNAEKDEIGETVTDWIQTNPFVTMEEKLVVQSDDFLSIMVFYSGQPGTKSPL
jgi:hypothetical protein